MMSLVGALVLTAALNAGLTCHFGRVGKNDPKQDKPIQPEDAQ